MAKITTVAQFKKALELGCKQIMSGKKNIWSAAQFAIAHYSEHGDHGPLNDILDALRNKVGLGASAYVKWVEKYSDQVFNQTEAKLVRDLGSNASERADVTGACAENFWDNIKTEQEAELFGADEFYKDVFKLVKRYQNEDKKTANDDDATAAVSEMLSHLTAKAPGVVLAA